MPVGIRSSTSSPTPRSSAARASRATSRSRCARTRATCARTLRRLRPLRRRLPAGRRQRVRHGSQGAQGHLPPLPAVGARHLRHRPRRLPQLHAPPRPSGRRSGSTRWPSTSGRSIRTTRPTSSSATTAPTPATSTPSTSTMLPEEIELDVGSILVAVGLPGVRRPQARQLRLRPLPQRGHQPRARADAQRLGRHPGPRRAAVGPRDPEADRLRPVRRRPRRGRPALLQPLLLHERGQGLDAASASTIPEVEDDHHPLHRSAGLRQGLRRLRAALARRSRARRTSAAGRPRSSTIPDGRHAARSSSRTPWATSSGGSPPIWWCSRWRRRPTRARSSSPRSSASRPTSYGFIARRDPAISAVETSRDGIFVCGSAVGPQVIPDCVAQASAAAARAQLYPHRPPRRGEGRAGRADGPLRSAAGRRHGLPLRRQHRRRARCRASSPADAATLPDVVVASDRPLRLLLDRPGRAGRD